MKSKNIIVIFLVVVAFVAYNAAYIIDETEQVVITQFGRVVGEPKKSPRSEIQDPDYSAGEPFSQISVGVGR